METGNFSPTTNADFEQCYSNELVTYLQRRLNRDDKINNILLAIVNSILALCGSFSNVFVILTYWQARDPSMKRLSNMLIIALTYSDLLVTILVQPLFVLRKGYYEIYGVKNCVLLGILRLGIFFSVGISAMTVIVITAERYIAIAKPYLYPAVITRKRLKAIIFILWIAYLLIVCSRISLLPLFVFTIVASIITTVYMISNSIMWIHILILTQKHKKAIRKQLTGVPRLMKQGYKEYFSVAHIIVLSTTLCYTPILLMTIYGAFYDMDFRYLYTLLPWAETLLFFNSFANSVIFTWREKKFRKALCALVRHKRSLIAPAIS